jgi:peptidoglycan/xylan/chitin deacetylase (PgdA/CDA1 family)
MMSQRIRTWVLYSLNIVGVFNFIKLVTRNEIRILAYHRFGERHVTAHSFERQIKYLKKHFNVIDIVSCLEFLGGKKKVKPNSVLLTVDDGYQDFYSVAFPILRRYAVPAVVFLTVDFLDKGIWFKHDLLSFALNNTNRADYALDGTVFDLTTLDGRVKLRMRLDEIYKTRGPKERDDFIRQVLQTLGVIVPECPTPDYAPLVWDQVLEMSKYGVWFGAHTCTHPILSRIPLNEALNEIQESKRRIQEVVQNDVLAFCYPNGTIDDFNDDVKNMVRDCGFECATSMIYGTNGLGCDKYALKRMAVGNSFAHFLQDVSGFGIFRASLGQTKTRAVLLSSLSREKVGLF